MEQAPARAIARPQPFTDAGEPAPRPAAARTEESFDAVGERPAGLIPERLRGEQLPGGPSLRGGAVARAGEPERRGPAGTGGARPGGCPEGEIDIQALAGQLVPAARSPLEMGSRTVQRHSVRGQILQALRTALVDGELIPGEVYSAPVLAERFGVSATPVREAMQRLASEGAVEVVPNRGFRITVRTPRELAELAEVRALIEVPVMVQLARTIPAAQWAQLRPLADATAAAAAVGDRARYAESDRSFHRAMLSLSGNDQLVKLAEDLHRRSQWPLTGAPMTRRAELVADAAEHMALLEALAAQDLPVVRTLVREHFTGAQI